MAASVKALKYNTGYLHGSAVAKVKPDPEHLYEPEKTPVYDKKSVPKRFTETKSAVSTAPGVSLFAIIGFFVVATLMIFVMLAQVNYNEVLRETARLNTHLNNLTEQQRVLSITFESVVNMDEVENYAKDVLGMSKPESEMQIVIRALPPDRVEVITNETNDEWYTEIAGYLSFLYDS